MEQCRIGIPSELLGWEKGVRLEFVRIADGLILLEKPRGISSKEDPWYGEYPNLERCFFHQIKTGKPELQHHGIKQLKSFLFFEPEMSAGALMSVDPATEESWKNALGSMQFTFHAILISSKIGGDSHKTCDLPLTRHFVDEKIKVSHKHGKKAYTEAHLIQKGRDAGAWLLSTRYPRTHQFRVHAREMGLPALKDNYYGKEIATGIEDENPFELQWLHLLGVSLDSKLNSEQPHKFILPPKHWKMTLRRKGFDEKKLYSDAMEKAENITLPAL